MSILTREQILGAADIQTETVSVPEWGGEVLVRGLSGIQRDALEADVLEMKGKQARMNIRNVTAKLVAKCIVDESGHVLFSDSDVVALGEKSASALTRVAEAAQRLSGLTEADVVELAKN